MRISDLLSETIDPKDTPPAPDVTGMQPGTSKDLGDGQRVKLNIDGTIELSGGWGQIVYNKQGKPLKTSAPKVAGLAVDQDFETGQKTVSYNAGPIQMAQTTDAKGKKVSTSSSYNLGPATLARKADHMKGITTSTVTPNDTETDPNQLLPTSDIAAARGVDPKKFAKFQQQNPSAVKENSELASIKKLSGLN